MSKTLRYAPLKWSSTSLGASQRSVTPEAFVDMLNIFGVEHNANSYDFDCDGYDCYDFEVDRESLKELRNVLLSGDFAEWQDEAYRACLKSMGVEHNDIVNAITQILSVKTEWIRLAWF